jgi:hypothetical protein
MPWILCIFILISNAALAEGLELEEIVVTAQRAEGQVPGTSLQRTGDFIHLTVGISNDARDEKMRKEEIYATLRAMLAAAAKDKSVELSVIGENNFVLPLRLNSATIKLSKGKRPDTSETTISVKTRIVTTGDGGSALVAKLKDFVDSVKPVGRTLIDDDGDVEISIVNPAQYRDQVISLFAADVRKATASLGGEYKVVASGIDRPIQWVRSGMLGVTIFVPYKYVLLPNTVTSLTASTLSVE